MGLGAGSRPDKARDMFKITAVFACLAFAGCASSGGVEPIGDGQYRINSASLLSSAPKTEQFGGLARARRYCGETGRVPLVKEDPNAGKVVLPISSITFECVLL